MTAFALVVALLLLAGNAFFVGAEFSVLSVRRSQIEPLAAGSRRARIVLAALRRLPLMLAASQLGVTLCSLGLGAVAEPSVSHLLERALNAAHLPETLLHPLSFAVALMLVVFLHVVLGEMVPRNIALAGPERAAVALVPLLVGFARATGPVLAAINAVANASLRLLRVERRDELTSAYTPDELAEIIGQSREQGLLDDSDHERLSGALSLRSRTARDVMLPLAQLVTVSAAVTADELEELVVLTGYSRFPVRSARDDPATPQVVEGGLLGFVHVKDVLPLADRRSALPHGVLRAMPELAPDLPLEEVLLQMQRAKSHLAQVVEGRGAIGVVALEDVVEEFVGEVADSTNPLNAPALTD